MYPAENSSEDLLRHRHLGHPGIAGMYEISQMGWGQGDPPEHVAKAYVDTK